MLKNFFRNWVPGVLSTRDLSIAEVPPGLLSIQRPLSCLGSEASITGGRFFTLFDDGRLDVPSRLVREARSMTTA